VAQRNTVVAEGVWKSFDKGRGDMLTTRQRMRMLRSARPRTSVLEDISFEVRAGEVMGCVGANGAGKSTLLKLIAGIYPCDRGQIWAAGRVAPLIELGVGFRPELPARENVLLNGVMMGLTPAEARRRTDEIIDFAELQDHTDLKLKNYSSGMRGRLGFSVMVHVDADILLIDEILSVGDKSFRDKCGDVISKLRRDGQTVILVSHEMGSIIRHCDRAMLLRDHRIQAISDPETVANRYHALHAARQIAGNEEVDIDAMHAPAVVTDLVVGGGEPLLRPAEPLRIEAEAEINERMTDPVVRFMIHDGNGRPIFLSPPQQLTSGGVGEPGERYRIHGTIENRLAPGSFVLACRVSEGEAENGREALRSPAKWAKFEVDGVPEMGTVVAQWSEIEVEPAVAETTAR
jgi:ABC-type polysaccharide/polyol phosphate transport system ATPase subunit